MTWAGHGVGAVAIGARADRRGLRGHGSRRRCRAGSPRPRARRSPASTTIFKRARRARPTRRTGLTMKSDRLAPVAIVGGGAFGDHPRRAARAARHRSVADRRQRPDGPRSRLFDHRARAPAQRPCRGDERLGRRARPFRQALRGRRRRPRGFAQRRFFGRYLGEILSRGGGAAAASNLSKPPRSARCGTAPAGGSASKTGRLSRPQALVLAVGNQEPEALERLCRSWDAASSAIRGAMMRAPRSRIWPKAAGPRCSSGPG